MINNGKAGHVQYVQLGIGREACRRGCVIAAIALPRRLNMLMSGRVDTTAPPCFMELCEDSVSVNNERGRGFLLQSNHGKDAVASPLSERASL